MMKLLRLLTIACLSFCLSLSCGSNSLFGSHRSARAISPQSHDFIPIVASSLSLEATGLEATTPVAAPAQSQTHLQQGKAAYDAGQFSEAAQQLGQAAKQFGNRHQPLNQARALALQSLSLQKLGQWHDAQAGLDQGLALLNPFSHSASAAPVLAQVWNSQGHLHQARGQAESALTAWATAEDYYRLAGLQDRSLGVQVNQAQAMQAMGFHNRASDLLGRLEQQVQMQPDSVLKLRGLLSLANVMRSRGEVNRAQELLNQSLLLAQRLNLAFDEAQVELSLGNNSRLLAVRAMADRARRDEATQLVAETLNHYNQAAALSPSLMLKVQARLNQLSWLVEQNQLTEASLLASELEQLLPQLPSSRASIYAQVNLAQSLIKQDNLLAQENLAKRDERVSRAAVKTNRVAVGPLLERAISQARDLDDHRAESYALGILGHRYETQQNWTQAESFTEAALELAQRLDAEDILYQWEWQLGRILQQGLEARTQSRDVSPIAMVHYQTAFETLERLRGDLVSVNPDLQFSFRESVEPMYREWVDLLLRSPQEVSNSSPSNLDQSNDSDRLIQARSVIESLQLAELDNFFQEACLSTRAVNVDQIDPQAAVIYPILLPNRIETIVSFGQGQLKQYSQPVAKDKVEARIVQLRRRLTLPIGAEYRRNSQQLYDWLIEPLEADLTDNQVKTLIFVLDGDLKNIPMAALSDGKQFLIEKYSLALTPGLQLLEPQALQTKTIGAITAGISEARQGFLPLPYVLNEVERIRSELPGQVLLNQEFTVNDLEAAVNGSPSPILHLATHGKFSSNKDETFVLAWDERLGIEDLSRLLRTAELNQGNAIELLVLSACQTASGDRKAPLGLAGLAVRSGARSTMASLWLIDDEATSELMKKFYSSLSIPGQTKADALRQAQLEMLNNPQFRHPYYWSAFVMLGNWL